MVSPEWFLLIVPIMWFVGGHALSYLDGWHALAQTHTSSSKFPRDTQAMRSAKVRVFWYQNAVHVGSDTDGIYLAVIWLLRWGHPRLFIPWTSIDVGPEKVMFLRSRRTFYLGKERIPLTLHGWLASFLLKNWN